MLADCPISVSIRHRPRTRKKHSYQTIHGVAGESGWSRAIRRRLSGGVTVLGSRRTAQSRMSSLTERFAGGTFEPTFERDASGGEELAINVARAPAHRRRSVDSVRPVVRRYVSSGSRDRARVFGVPGKNPYCHHRARHAARIRERSAGASRQAFPSTMASSNRRESVDQPWPADDFAFVQRHHRIGLQAST